MSGFEEGHHRFVAAPVAEAPPRPELRDGRFSFVMDEPARLLVIDDDPIICEFASVYLSTPVVSVEIAGDGAEGLERLAAERFDLCMVDLDMPRLDGFEFIRRVRAEPAYARLPLVVVTGREDVESIDAAYRAGATSFLTKPINWRLLSYQLRYVLRAQRALAA
ncbi:MAG: response regulator [Methylobacteriaceae bacterium]|nr:response regulator [Methylobacteriaceae bacterium]